MAVVIIIGMTAWNLLPKKAGNRKESKEMFSNGCYNKEIMCYT